MVETFVAQLQRQNSPLFHSVAIRSPVSVSVCVRALLHHWGTRNRGCAHLCLCDGDIHGVWMLRTQSHVLLPSEALAWAASTHPEASLTLMVSLAEVGLKSLPRSWTFSKKRERLWERGEEGSESLTQSWGAAWGKQTLPESLTWLLIPGGGVQVGKISAEDKTEAH